MTLERNSCNLKIAQTAHNDFYSQLRFGENEPANAAGKIRETSLKIYRMTELYSLINFQGEKTMTQTATQRAATTEAREHSEGIVARTIEEQTAKLPSDIFLWGALGSIGISLYFEIKGNAEKSRFVGQWVSPFLLLGVYNKLVKLAGSDRINK